MFISLTYLLNGVSPVMLSKHLKLCLFNLNKEQEASSTLPCKALSQTADG